MGADMIVVGFVVDTATQPDTPYRVPVVDAEAAKAVLAAMSDETLLSLVEHIDPSGAMEMIAPDEDLIGDLRDALNDGADEVAAAARGHRYSSWWEHPVSHRAFVLAGGTSWGDDPFEGFDNLCYTLNLCHAPEGAEFAAALGVLSLGLGAIT
jgi:hypothetical protein